MAIKRAAFLRAPLHVVDVVVIKSLNLCVNGEEINLRSLMSLLISHQNAPNFNRYFICHFTLVYFVGLFAYFFIFCLFQSTLLKSLESEKPEHSYHFSQQIIPLPFSRDHT